MEKHFQDLRPRAAARRTIYTCPGARPLAGSFPGRLETRQFMIARIRKLISMAPPDTAKTGEEPSRRPCIWRSPGSGRADGLCARVVAPCRRYGHGGGVRHRRPVLALADLDRRRCSLLQAIAASFNRYGQSGDFQWPRLLSFHILPVRTPSEREDPAKQRKAGA